MENVMTSSDRKVVFLKLDDILPNRFQPRIKFDEEALNELSQSIKEHGVLSPITVRPLGNKYEIVAGERRYKAATMAGLTDIPAMVINMTDKESAEIALIENVQRKDLTPIEEAISYKKIFDMNIGISQEMLAKKLGKSQSAIANKLRLLNLSDEVQEALLENKISERHARSLLRIKDKRLQNDLLEKIIKERLTVRRTDEEIINMLSNNKDIEILDFEDQNTPIRNEKINNPLNRFESLYNLPKTPIIEDKEDEFIPNIPDVTSNEVPPFKDIEFSNINNSKIEDESKQVPVDNPTINPGFLDIDKIEKEASDINAKPNKLSLEELLRMPNNPTQTSNENVFSPINSNRFFTMVEDEDDSGNTNVRFESNNELEKSIDDSKNLTSDFEFNGKFIPQEESLFEKLDKEEPLEKSQLSGFNNEIFNNPSNLNNDILGNNHLNENKESNNINSFDSFNFDNSFSDKNPVNEGNLGPQNLFESEPIDYSKNINLKPENIFSNGPIGEFELPKNDIVEDVEINEEIPIIQEEIKPVPPMGYTIEQQNSTSDYVPVYDFLDEKDEVVEEKHDNSKYGAADLKTIINTIRKCAETIEKYGYIIDTEEFDFEDMYQVIFKIEKKQ